MNRQWHKFFAASVLIFGLIGVGFFIYRGDASKNSLSNAVQLPTVTQTTQAAKPGSPVKNINSQAITPQTFELRARKILKELPTIQALRALPEEQTHRTPEIISKAGAELGELAQTISDHPELEPKAYEFYESCASRSVLPTSIRALCLSNLSQLGRRMGRRVDPSQYPDSVRDLSQQIQPWD